MVMANFSEFNNNNYLPAPPGFPPEMAAATFYPPPSAQFRGPGLHQNGFTFTSPTQCSTLATHRPSIQTTSPISYLSAPGVGTSWQHSIPVTMPWVDMKSHMSQPGFGTATVFTGVPQSSYQESQPCRRPKRKALDLPDNAPMSKVYLCADQFANMRISQTEQQRLGSAQSDSAGDHQFHPYRTQSQTDIEGWQRFREVESRLNVEVDEDLDVKISSDRNSDGPCVKVAEGVLTSAASTSPILPRKVMEDIAKPCMEVVLWKSPGELIREVSKEDSTNTTSTSLSTATNVVDSKYSTVHQFNLNQLPLRDSIMEANSDITEEYMTFNISQPPPAMRHRSLSLGDPLPSSSPFNRAASFSSGLGINRVNTSSTCAIAGDLDMFDSVDDEMQL